MLKLFSRKPDTENRNLEDSAYVNILPKMKREIETTINIHKRRKRPSDTKDIIVRLLKSVVIGKNDSVVDYVRKNTEYVKNAARIAGLTGMQNKGKIFRDLYTNNEYAMYLYITEINSFKDMFDWEDNWKNVTPVTIHYTSCTDMSMNLPTDYDNVLEVTSLYSLNIPMLLTQYKQYTNQRESFGLEVNIQKFVNIYVYSNMIKQFYDHALSNRYFAIANNELMEEFSPNYPGTPLNFTKNYDKLASKSIKNSKKGYTFTRFLDTVITTTEHTTNIYQLPDFYLNPFIMTAFHFGTSDNIRRLIMTAHPKTLKLEKKLLQEYMLFLKVIHSNSMIKNFYPPEIKSLLDDNTSEILDKLKGNK